MKNILIILISIFPICNVNALTRDSLLIQFDPYRTENGSTVVNDLLGSQANVVSSYVKADKYANFNDTKHISFPAQTFNITDGNFTIYQVIKFNGESLRDGIETLSFNNSGFSCSAFRSGNSTQFNVSYAGGNNQLSISNMLGAGDIGNVVIITYVADFDNSLMKIYKDGVFEGQIAYTNKMIDPTSRPFRIGRTGGESVVNTRYYSVGVIDSAHGIEDIRTQVRDLKRMYFSENN